MEKITTEDLKTTYKVIDELAKMHGLTYDNSFVRVRNKIANEMMLRLINGKED